jgi:3-dehydroquinate synthase
VPTTLWHRSTSISGKVGVSHALGKNLIGAFYQPHAVAIDPSVLQTLPRREFRAGLYEVIKYGMTSSRPLFDRVGHDRTAIFSKDRAALTAVIAESCRIKASVVAADEREAGPRRILNFGHSAGHALEADPVPPLRHGEAVAYGMLVAAELGVMRGALRRRIAPRSPTSLPASVPCRRLPTSPPAESSTRCSTTRRWSRAGSARAADGRRQRQSSTTSPRRR